MMRYKAPHETLLLNLHANMIEEMDKIVKYRHEWMTRTEFIRDAIRNHIEKNKVD